MNQIFLEITSLMNTGPSLWILLVLGLVLEQKKYELFLPPP